MDRKKQQDKFVKNSMTSRDKSVRRSAQEDGFVERLTKTSRQVSAYGAQSLNVLTRPPNPANQTRVLGYSHQFSSVPTGLNSERVVLTQTRNGWLSIGNDTALPWECRRCGTPPLPQPEFR
jgi:hypothetical protein